jgi:hypothetical protein
MSANYVEMRGPSYAVGHRAGQNMAISGYARIGGRAGQESQLDTMGKADKLFTDGEAYEGLMDRRSRLVGETFLYWLDTPKNLRWLDVGCGNGAFTELLAVPLPQLRRLIRPMINWPMRDPGPE